MGYTKKELAIIDAAFAVFVRSISKVMDAEQIGFIDKAYKLALDKYDGKKTISGGLYILSLIEMADRLARVALSLVIGGGIGTPPMLPLAQIYGEKATVITGFRSANAVILQSQCLGESQNRVGCSTSCW